MKISMLENGIDSFHRGFSAYTSYLEKISDGHPPTLEDYCELKQAILYTHHGVEILVKYILQQESKYLIIDKIDVNYRQAIKELKSTGHQSVFSTSKKDSIHTIDYTEAIARAESFCDFQLGQQAKEKLNALNKVRNALTHAEIDVDDSEIAKIFDNILNELDELFYKAIGKDYETNAGYSKLKVDYEKYISISPTDAVKNEAMKALLEAIKKSGTDIRENEPVLITDVKQIQQIIKAFSQTKQLTFGFDMFNGWCSGNAKVKCSSEGIVTIWADDNRGEYVFIIRSLLLFVPKMTDNCSPIFILESANCQIPKDRMNICEDSDGVKYTDTVMVQQGESYKELMGEEQYEFYSRCDNDEYFVVPYHYDRTQFYSQHIMVCLNIQGMAYPNFRNILRNINSNTGEQVLEMLKSK